MSSEKIGILENKINGGWIMETGRRKKLLNIDLNKKMAETIFSAPDATAKKARSLYLPLLLWDQSRHSELFDKVDKDK